ncbi:hypothetical protein GWK47_027876 [Chionoecetes opilio]|uniref:Uncharacterized protein n=1 Tax=Chionoecetes opilio TaxID=41210 RepID=A0A8J8W8Y3_CHIOP|nr:hypothetical protein GWK47_027876 [Chionoecetes opilio]
MGAYSEDQGERFHQDILDFERRYRGSYSVVEVNNGGVETKLAAEPPTLTNRDETGSLLGPDSPHYLERHDHIRYGGWRKKSYVAVALVRAWCRIRSTEASSSVGPLYMYNLLFEAAGSGGNCWFEGAPGTWVGAESFYDRCHSGRAILISWTAAILAAEGPLTVARAERGGISSPFGDDGEMRFPLVLHERLSEAPLPLGSLGSAVHEIKMARHPDDAKCLGETLRINNPKYDECLCHPETS